MQHSDAAIRKSLLNRLHCGGERLEIQLLRFFDDRMDDVDLRAGVDLFVDECVDLLDLR